MLPPGFEYQEDFITLEEEKDLLDRFRGLSFSEFKFRGYSAKRRIVSYGWHYSFESYRLAPAKPIPPFLETTRKRAAEWARQSAQDFSEALVTEYPPGAGIGWHKDAAPFGVVVGVSLGSPCKMKLRPVERQKKQKSLAILLAPRSAYFFSGEARERWEHQIPGVEAVRYSITFRTLKPPIAFPRQSG